MQGKIKHEPQLDLFRVELKSIIQISHSLVLLSQKIKWDEIEAEFSQYYSKDGRPSVPTRTMVGLLLLKSMFDQSDEELIPRWVENPYWQFFCGEQYFRHDPPCDPSDLVHFRKRITQAGHQYLLRVSAHLHGEDSQEKQVLIDTTVQEKNITFPTDAKLAYRILKKCWEIATDNKLQLHQSYRRKSKEAILKLRFSHHPKKKKDAVRAVKDLRRYARKVINQLKKKLPEQVVETLNEKFIFYFQVLSQKRNDKNKIYSLHEPDVYCMSKGKSNKPYEFGCKVSVALTQKSGIVVGMQSFETNVHDTHTLEKVIEQVGEITGTLPDEAICDRGYRGKQKIKGTTISIPKPLPSTTSRYEKNKVRIKFKRRAAIEPVIGHLKFDHRMYRNFLKGIYGDFVNCVLAAAGFNLKKMLRKIASSWEGIKTYILMVLYWVFRKKLAF